VSRSGLTRVTASLKKIQGKKKDKLREKEEAYRIADAAMEAESKATAAAAASAVGGSASKIEDPAADTSFLTKFTAGGADDAGQADLLDL
jgi:hypothetical protein